MASYLPLWGPREEIIYWNRSTCNFGNFASARVWLSNLRQDPFVGRFDRYPAFRLRLALLISHAFLRPHVVNTVPLLPPRHFLSTFKIDELAREQIVSILKLSAHVKDPSKIHQQLHHKSVSSNFQAIFNDEIILLFAINFFSSFWDI